MALPENQQLVKEMTSTLTTRLVGNPVDSYGHFCNESDASGKIINILPGGNNYPGQELQWALWSVQVAHYTKKQPGTASYKLYDFIAPEELEELFKKHFKDAPFKIFTSHW